MLRDLSLPSDGPGEALAELARRLGLRYSRTHVRAAIERHPQPGSLLAFVEVARTLGLEPTAGRADIETLDGLESDELPAVLHFESDMQNGFGLLERVTPEGFAVWDSQRGSRVLERSELVESWSGIAVFVEKVGGGARERGYLLHRAKEILLEEWRPAVELSAPAVRPLRIGLGVLVLLLIGLAIHAQPLGARLSTAILAGLAALGFSASAAALTLSQGGRASRLCGAGGALDCESVLRSPYARIAGVPLAGVGFAFFGAVLLLLCAAALRGPAPVWTAGALFLPTLPASAVLVALQIRLRRFCALCMTVHAVNLAGAATFLFLVPPGPPTGTPAALALVALLFGLLLSTAVPLWSRREDDTEPLRRLHRALSRSPLASLAELTLEPRRAFEPAATGVLLGDAAAPRALLVLAHPTCKLCGPVLDELEALVERHEHAVRGHVAVAPRDPTDPWDQDLCEALCAVGLAFGGAALLAAFRLAKQDLKKLRAGDPFAALAAGLRIDPAMLAGVRDRARALVREAAALKDRYTHGIPAVFLDGRRCEAPLRHVDAWLEQPALAALLPPPPVEGHEGRVET